MEEKILFDSKSCDLRKEGNLLVVTLKDKENRVGFDFITNLTLALEKAERCVLKQIISK